MFRGGVIELHGLYNGNPVYYDCVWKLAPKNGMRVAIHMLDLHLESREFVFIIIILINY